MKRMLAALLLMLFALPASSPAQDVTGAKKRLLLITESRGFVHGVVARPSIVVAKSADFDQFPKMDGLEVKLVKEPLKAVIDALDKNMKKLSKDLENDKLSKEQQKGIAELIKKAQDQMVKAKEKNKDKIVVAYNGRLTKPLEIKTNGKLLATVEPCLVEKTFMKLAEKTGFFDVDCSQNSRAELTSENLKNYDAVFFYTTGEMPLSDAQKSDLLAFVKSGKGFGGSHCATDTFYKWKEYGELIGGYFDGHPWHQKVKVIVEDTKHPATKHLGDTFEITDEIYQFRGPYGRDKVHVLMRLDMDSVKNPGKRADKDNALSWTHDYGKGRVFYTALGHRDEVWNDPRFQQHVIGGLRYMFGLEK